MRLARSHMAWLTGSLAVTLLAGCAAPPPKPRQLLLDHWQPGPRFRFLSFLSIVNGLPPHYDPDPDHVSEWLRRHGRSARESRTTALVLVIIAFPSHTKVGDRVDLWVNPLVPDRPTIGGELLPEALYGDFLPNGFALEVRGTVFSFDGAAMVPGGGRVIRRQADQHANGCPRRSGDVAG